MSDSLNVLATWPSADLFNLPPFGQPAPIPPADAALSIMHPFNIPASWFRATLDAKVPLTIAATYAVTIKLLNRYNRSRNKQPWSISKTAPFKAFVVFHNIFLAVYSAWTFWGMLGGMKRSIRSPTGPGGIAATVDSLCRVHGASGLGNSVFFNETSGQWMTTAADAPAALFDAAGNPNPNQMGRLWNEGLAYYGWIFYLSKFYEVLDTFIILAKGKYSSTLQTYHHAGAMLCMWAGIRYMTVPIWVFVLVNSFIHALMYTYYTVTAFSIKVPMALKRTLTSMQITQFVLGASYAMIHSFVSYLVPISTTKTAGAVIASPAAPADFVVPTAIGSIKNIIFGSGSAATASAGSNTVYAIQSCVTTSPETFAIWLNVLYLAPLTYLFGSFFVASYIKRSNAATKANGKAARRYSNVNVALAEKAGWDAARSVEREVYGGEAMLRSGSSSPVTEDAPAAAKSLRGDRTRRRA